jgi:hypothetical protein
VTPSPCHSQQHFQLIIAIIVSKPVRAALRFISLFGLYLKATYQVCATKQHDEEVHDEKQEDGYSSSTQRHREQYR